MFTISSWTRRDLVDKDMGQAYDQPKQVMARINNCATKLSGIPFLTSIPEKIPWKFLWASGLIHKVHTYAKAVPTDQGIRSLGTSIETFKGEALIIKEEGATKADGAFVQSDVRDRWVMYVYPLVLPHNVKRYMKGLRVLCLR